MLDFCIIGSGVSGSTIAYLLSKRYSVHILDKARGPGGRASNKRFKQNLSFDHGVQYISPKSKEFLKFIKTLCKKKEAKIWTGNHLDFTFKKKEISEKFIGMKGNNFISKFYTKKVKKSFQSSVISIFLNKYFWEIKLDNGEYIQAKSIILTCPFPQSKKIAGKYLEKKISNLKINMEPNITTMLAFKNQKAVPVSSIKFNDDILTWAAHENSKSRFNSSNSLWPLQSSVEWAKKNINHYKTLQTVIPSPNGIMICSTLLSSDTNLLNSLIFMVNLSLFFSSATSPCHKTLSIMINPPLFKSSKDFS